MSKTLQLIRHGHSLHNELFHKIGVRAFRIPETIDAPLTQQGHTQSIELGNSWPKKQEIQLILTSPLTRTLETTMNIFGDTDIPIECHEFLREYPIGHDTCNKRASLTTIKNRYPKIKYHLESDTDIFWQPDQRETLESLNERINQMIEYVRSRNETNIAIIGHSSFLGQFKDKHIAYQENGEQDLKHCYPYEYVLE